MQLKREETLYSYKKKPNNELEQNYVPAAGIRMAPQGALNYRRVYMPGNPLYSSCIYRLYTCRYICSCGIL